MKHVISLGGGTQSTVMLLLANRGEITPRPEVAIFADTEWEPAAVYEHLAWLEAESEIPIVRVRQGNLRTKSLEGRGDTRENAAGYNPLPLFGWRDGARGIGVIGQRQCTSNYKIRPIEAHVRDIVRRPGEKAVRATNGEPRAVQWMGITTDEAQRARGTRRKWLTARYPLLELGMSRLDCILWWGKAYPDRHLPRSACVGCPFRTDDEWRALTPEEWDDAVEYDEAIRHQTTDGIEAQYLHHSRRPLAEVDLGKHEGQGDLFGCTSGYCFV